MPCDHSPWAGDLLIDDLFPIPESSPPLDNPKQPSSYGSPVSIIAQPGKDELPPPITLAPVVLLPGIQVWTYRALAAAAIAVLVIAPVATATQLLVSLDLPWGVFLAGFVAQLVDGSLGMGFGITSATVLTTCAGVSPTMASSAVHLAQLGTTAVSGYSHRQCGNTHDGVLRKLTPPGVVGALVGSMLLSSLATKTSKLVSGSVLFAVGAYVLFRFSMQAAADTGGGDASAKRAAPPSAAFLVPLGFVGGAVDALGGGGWGPVATSGLLAEGGLPPAQAIGTVSLSEFFVTVAAVVGFLLVLGPSHAAAGAMRLDLALMLLVGGLLAAPIAPHLVRRIEPRNLGRTVGAFICLTNLRVFL